MQIEQVSCSWQQLTALAVKEQADGCMYKQIKFDQAV